ncbi:DNA glycosylase [Lentinula detonsa]|uniref:DNA glycosylase n=1 Tax=Lentinula detonsa TaxID=2804962 RepID=A0A9W8TX72_9AGAR|nr:DNA glycosylase [Lentinula detonsa]
MSTTRKVVKRIHRNVERNCSPSRDINQSQTAVIIKPQIKPQTIPESPHRAKKRKLLESYASESPFLNFPHPTPSEAVAVFNILSEAHPQFATRRVSPKLTTNSAATCGNVPNVIDSLIGTILSQNTSGRNSSRAKESLDAAFGRNNFSAIAKSPRDAVVEAIHHGGLANKKAATIQNLLKSIQERHGEYSLQHLAEMGKDGKQVSIEEVMKELTSYDGVGPKTASCVLMFCLGRDSFAVDTHIFRLSKVLGWVPSSADRILTQAHLDRMLPAKLKYGLHVLMIQHGRTCKGCKKSGSSTPCILKDFVKETMSSGLALNQGIS